MMAKAKKKYSESRRSERIGMMIFASLFFAFGAWIVAVKVLHGIPEIEKKGAYLWYVFQQTYQLNDIRLLFPLIIPPIIVFTIGYFMKAFRPDIYTGEKYKKHLRGTQIVSPETLINVTRESAKSDKQLTVAGIPIPRKVEALHILMNGSTGTGKSVSIKEMMYCIKERQELYKKLSAKGDKKQLDRVIAIDPNGDLYSLFADPKKDILLNPFDDRTKGWNLFNEIKNEADYNRFSFSIVPRSEGESEKWNSYARLLLKECMKYVKNNNERPSMKDVQYMATVLEEDKLKELLSGTDAEAMFVKGADKALGSARFTLSDRLPAFNLMPDGDFSILDALSDESEIGNIYITWKEDQKDALKPLITTFADIFISGILSLPPSKTRSLFVSLDELSSMDAISSLRDGLEKGRKHGLKVIAGLQTVKQLTQIYGETEAIILMSCFRNLFVLGGSSTDHETANYMSSALGEMEVLRDQVTSSSGQSSSRSRQVIKATEHVVLASEIMNLPDLNIYINFAGDYPITRTKLIPKDYPEINKQYVPLQNFEKDFA